MKNTKFTLAFIFVTLIVLQTFSQDSINFNQDIVSISPPEHKYFFRFPYIIIPTTQIDDTPSVKMLEFHIGKRIESKTTIGIKAAKWSLFAPMGILWWDEGFMQKSEWYSGRLKEYGVGVFYQRILWKGLYASVEVMPMLKTFVDETDAKIENGFRLYTSYHLGYYFSFFKDRLFLEPQIHCNYWPINSKGPDGFREQTENHRNYFLFEPNIYIGVNF